MLNLPGSVTSAVTCFDGYPMAQKSEAGKALAMTTLASFIGGCFSIVLMMAFAAPLVAVAQSFGSRELLDGISLVVLAMGLFGVSEILVNFTSMHFATTRQKVDTSWAAMWPTKKEWKSTSGSMARGSVIAAFVAYSVEKKVSKTPERFGNGTIEGLAASETANNSAAQAAFIPTMSLGIPGSATMALLLGALLIHGVQPGPLVISTNPELFWGLIASFWIGNLLLLVLNLPLIGIWVRMLMIPYRILYPCILFFICLGAYSARSNPVDIGLVILFGLMGYGMKLLQLPAAPLLLGLVLGPMAEEHFRRSLLLSRGDATVFVTQPISADILAVAVIIVASTIRSSLRKRRQIIAAQMAENGQI